MTAVSDRSPPVLPAGWLAAALGGTLALVGPQRELEVALEDGCDVDAALDALAPDLDRASLAAALGDAASADELIAALSGAGALSESSASKPALSSGEQASSLTDALLAATRGERLTAAGPALVATADEVLVLPAGLTADTERRALHAFVGSITPDLRLRAYCRVVVECVAAVRGDRPSADRLRAALAAIDPSTDDVRVVDLATGAEESVAPADLARIGCERPHRLGPLTSSAPLARAERSPAPDMYVHGAGYAVANLRFPEAADVRIGGGRAPSADLAELIARAEAAERYAAGDLTGHTLLRARVADLDAPHVAPERLYRRSRRQLRDRSVGLVPFDPAAEHLWVAGATQVGDRRWLPADAVFYPFFDPVTGGRTLPTNSSGGAAHMTFEAARTRALQELIERDAFMWTWIQRVERELIDARSLPTPARDRAAAIERLGLTVAFVNLTLDLLPVVACVFHSRERIGLALACDPDPAVAVERTLKEAIALLEVIERGRLGPIAPERVRTPIEHAALHLDPERIERDRFLFGSADRVGLAEVAVDGSADDLLAGVGEPVAVDLSTPATAPFAVARAVVPDLVPIAFGYDREPLGMPRLATPKRTHDGRRLGAELDLDDAGPLDPHPFA
jgi:ribosomal protein S12 methylthiotransferase accessory factor